VADSKIQIDHIDREIIRALQKNGRESYKNIARNLDVSDGTVRLRVDKMIRNNYLKISASVNPLFFENCIFAQVGLNLEKRADKEIMERLSQFDGVQSVNNVTGRYDLVIELFVNSREELRLFLVEELSAIGGIKATESFIFLETINKWVEIAD
jgi:Lrp/AsnC family transcriptional regulator for asnA, asnC and gidA